MTLGLINRGEGERKNELERERKREREMVKKPDSVNQLQASC